VQGPNRKSQDSEAGSSKVESGVGWMPEKTQNSDEVQRTHQRQPRLCTSNVSECQWAPEGPSVGRVQ